MSFPFNFPRNCFVSWTSVRIEHYLSSVFCESKNITYKRLVWFGTEEKTPNSIRPNRNKTKGRFAYSSSSFHQPIKFVINIQLTKSFDDFFSHSDIIENNFFCFYCKFNCIFFLFQSLFDKINTEHTKSWEIRVFFFLHETFSLGKWLKCIAWGKKLWIFSIE